MRITGLRPLISRRLPAVRAGNRLINPSSPPKIPPPNSRYDTNPNPVSAANHQTPPPGRRFSRARRWARLRRTGRRLGPASVGGMLRNKFLAGLAFAIPLIATFWLIGVLYGALSRLNETLIGFMARVGNFFIRPEPGQGVTVDSFSIDLGFFEFNLIGLALSLLVLLGLGFMATNVIGRRIVGAVDALLLRIPLVSFVYKALKQVSDALRDFGGSGPERKFKRVVRIQSPTGQGALLGFVTGFTRLPGDDYCVNTVFVPTAPNPMSGFVVLVEEQRTEEVPISVEDALKLILSAGLVAPPADADQTPAPTPRPPAAATAPATVEPDHPDLPLVLEALPTADETAIEPTADSIGADPFATEPPRSATKRRRQRRPGRPRRRPNTVSRG